MAVAAAPALAHGAERGFVMLLPTQHFVVGGALAVAVSFFAATVIPPAHFERFFGTSTLPGSFRLPRPAWTSLICGVLLAALILAGFNGARDPLANPLPLTIWTVWWVGIVLAHAVLGHLWLFLNPFTGLLGLAGRRAPLLRLPASTAYLPALLSFALFAWFQLVSPAPEDPARLAVAVAVYAVFTLAAGWLFGPEEWFRRNDPFAVYLRLLALAAPVGLTAETNRIHVRLRVPGAGLAAEPPLPIWGMLFVLLTLAAISFDGLSQTFFWLGLGGINPLDFPGRTAVMAYNTLGLLESFALLAALFMEAVMAGWQLAGRPGALMALMGRLVLSLIPISIAFHFAHYLPDLLVNGQYVALALNDPLFRGANLLGLEGYHVTASFLNTPRGAHTIYFVQTAAIVAGHMLSVAVAHLLLIRTGASGRRLLLLEAPLAVFMVAYTAFGLWILSSPSAG
jgi:hypothetical protein